ncbi:Type II secretion system protein F [Rosistilla ulvae]|uniref:Type II secretion system protein F n=2 Tax=Rosistilla ulvae TaxID=1930277 RepID=A0A517M840_9BACT|nr:Type II secretion system protein F [Rosistilla ulvae]
MFSKGMSQTVAARFCRRMATGFHAGVDLLKLCQRESQHGSPKHKAAMEAVAAQLRDGTPMARAMIDVADGKYFPPLMIQMVHIGETTGRLERTLKELADHYDHRLAMQRMFLMGIAWPMLQLIGGIAVIGLAILITQMLGSEFNAVGLNMTQYLTLVFLFFGSITAAVLALKFNAFGCHRLFALVYRIPKAGEALQTIALSRICWTLSLALDSGMDAMRSVKMALQSTQNDHFASRADTAIATIKSGGTLTESFASTGIFPEEFLHFVEVAELSGTDAESLGNLADVYDQRAKTATRVLVGVMTGVIWAAVTIMLVAIILKMAMSVFGVYDEALKM